MEVPAITEDEPHRLAGSSPPARPLAVLMMFSLIPFTSPAIILTHDSTPKEDYVLIPNTNRTLARLEDLGSTNFDVIRLQISIPTTNVCLFLQLLSKLYRLYRFLKLSKFLPRVL